MILVADSGSTKTSWAVTDTENKIVTEGLNPHFTSDETFMAVCQKVRQHFSTFNLQPSIFFYGAGCGNPTQHKRAEHLLSKAFDTEKITVETDMLGACRAASGHEASLVGILGTGSNACYYDGTCIKCQPTSTGYILGDKGSANHVGRILLNDYLTHRMPAKTRRLFHDKFQQSDTKLMDAVYHMANANRFLASLAPFAVEHQNDDDYCGEVIWSALHDWYFDPLQTLRQRARYPEGTLNIVGGFAKAIEPTLRRYFKDSGLTVGNIIADPMKGLLAYHST